MALTPEWITPPRGPAPSGRADGTIDTAVVATTAAFADGALLSQTVIVPTWLPWNQRNSCTTSRSTAPSPERRCSPSTSPRQ